ncbi:IPT/TIG domain-containing protein [bacterium]|nr:IPT/TIG domain-containing protein [bacterium]
MKLTASGMARKLLLAVLSVLLLASASCAAGGALKPAPGTHSRIAATRLNKAGQLAKQTSGAPVGLRLTWGFVDDPEVVGYYLYRDSQSIPDPGPDGFIDPSLRVNGGATIDQPAAGPDVVYDDIFDAEIGTTYYYRVTVLDSLDQESYPSNEISWTVHGHNVASLTPTEAYYGDQVTITGDTFGTYDSATDKVFFTALSGPPVEGNVVSWNDTEIVAEVPVGSFDGPVSISIDSTLAQSENLTILNPILTLLSPDQQFIGDSITISGHNFGASQDASTLSLDLDDLSASVSSWADEEIQLTLPASAHDGSVSVTVLGVQSNNLNLQIRPFITSGDILNPQSGEVLTLSGNNFDAQPGKVYLDGSSEQLVGNWADGELTFTLDAPTLGLHTLTVEDEAGLLSNELEIDVVAPLSVTVVGIVPSQLYRVADAASILVSAATAADADQVELLIDDVVVASSATAPFSDLPLQLDVLKNGEHNISMRAARRAVSVDSIAVPILVYSLTGDVDGSGVVDAEDAAALRPLIGLPSSDPAFRAWFDTNEDGEINESDLSRIGYGFGNSIPGLP